MSKKQTENAENASMDMMSCLIGCIILILIGILIIIMLTQTMLVIVEPDNRKLEAIEIAHVAGIQEDKAFPHGNKTKEPTYFDIHADKIVIYPGEITVSVREMERRNNAVEENIERVKRAREDEYIVLLIRPQAAEFARRVRTVIRDEKLIDLGVELVDSETPVTYDESTRKLSQEVRRKIKEKVEAERKERLETAGQEDAE